MKYIRVITTLILLFHLTSLSAQNENTDTLEKKIVTLNEAVISANKFEEIKKTVAQQIQIIYSAEINKLNPQNTADLVANTGNILVQKSQLGGGSPIIRGFEASRVLLVIDGVRMNNIIYRAGHLQNIVTADNNSLERVEILYGPSSTMYGSDALGGVIHLITKRPVLAKGDQKLYTKAHASTRFSSANKEISGHLDVNLGFRKIASLTSVSYSQFGDLRGGSNLNPFYGHPYGERPYYVKRINGKDSLVKNDDRYLQVQSGYMQYDLMQKFLYQQSQNLSHTLNIQYSNSGNVPRYDRLTDPSGSGLKSAEWYYGPQTRLLTAYELNRKQQEAFFQDVQFGINYQSVNESRHNRNFNSINTSHRAEQVNVVGASLDCQKTMKGNIVRLGFDGQYNTLKSTAYKENIVTGETSPLDTRYPDGKNSLLNLAVYYSHTWLITKNLTLVDGLRVGYSMLHSSLVDTALLFHLPFTTIDQNTPVYSGNIGLIHSPSDDLKFSLMISTGYRVPNADDMSKIFASAPGDLIVPNPDLKPEKTINYELGICKIFNSNTKWENYIFYTQFRDAIVTDNFTYEGKDSVLYEGTLSRVLANQNKREAYIYGISSNLDSKINENLSMSLVLNYTYGRVKTDSFDYPLDHIPPLMIRYQMAYKIKNFSTVFFINYNGWKKLKDYNLEGEDNEQYATEDGMPAWFTLNLHASYKILKYLSVEAGIDNIFDTQYRTFASGINAPGRNVFISLKANL